MAQTLARHSDIRLTLLLASLTLARCPV
jgi:hypothetical protein